MGRKRGGGGDWQMGKRNVWNFLDPPARTCKRFCCPPPPPHDAFIIKPYSHPPLSALLACLLLAPLAVQETIMYVNVQLK